MAEYSGTSYGPIPFWAWNGTMTEEGIKDTIKKLHENHFDGFFIHPRPGMTNEYLSQEWFSLWDVAQKQARRYGMKACIYDENTYPSGYAGGHIMSRLSDCAATSLKVRKFSSGREVMEYLENPELPQEEKEWIKLYRAQWEGDKVKALWDVTEEERAFTQEGAYLGIFRQRVYASAWYGGFPNTDILRPEVTRAFIETTYEPYYQRFGEAFGSHIPAVFSDEPGISPGSVYLDDPMCLPYSLYLSYEFEKRRGYSLEEGFLWLVVDKVEDLETEGVEPEKIRFDYYRTLSELWKENFAEPIHAWCRERNINWTGHFLDERWPYPWGCASPALMSMYEYMDWPGVDMLMTRMLKEDGTSPMLLSLKELSGVAEQLGKERLLCECYGAGGWDAGIEDFKRIGDWLAVNGINLFNPHLVMESVAGVRKYGHPQSIDWREPWWQEYGELNWYFERLCRLLAQGEQKNSILLLHPTTTWFLKIPSCQKGDILWDYQEMPKSYPVKTYVKLLLKMTEEKLSFDLGDEFLLQKYARVEEGHLRVGKARYDVVVIPGEMEHMLSSTSQLLRQAEAAGIPVVALGAMPRYEDGIPKDDLGFSPLFLTREAFVEKMCQEGRRTAELNNPCISCIKKITGKGQAFLFFTNSTPKKQEGRLYLPREVKVCKVDLITGEEHVLWPERWEEGQGILVHLGSCESLMLRTEHGTDGGDGKAPEHWADGGDGKAPEHKSGYGRKEELRLIKASRKEPNLLVLDYGSLKLRNKTLEPIYVWHACQKVYRAHGFERNPWDMSVQFKNRHMERNSFHQDSGYEMTYRFYIEKLPGTLFAVWEHPALTCAKVNGHPVNTAMEKWMDADMGKYEITPLIQEGLNELSLLVSPFHVLAEIQPVYLLGEFSLKQQEGQFRIGEAQTLMLGDLYSQGAPFYGGRVRYDFELYAAKALKSCLFFPGSYRGTALSLYVNGAYYGQFGMGQAAVDIGPRLKPGRNHLALELSCSLKNVFGPFHTGEPVRNQAWPGAFYQAPVARQPRAEEYDLIPYGLLELPHVVWGE